MQNRSKLLRCSGVVVAALTATAVLYASAIIGSPAAAASRQSGAEIPTGGTWYTYTAWASLGGPSVREQVPCPAGTTNYQGPAQPYSCLSVFVDQTGHHVGLRQGRSGPTGFGLLHLQVDHNLDERDAELLIQGVPGGIAQGNDRFVYGATYRYNDAELISVEFIEDRKPSTAAPDDYSLGLLTGYCRAGGQTAPIDQYCPPLPPPFN